MSRLLLSLLLVPGLLAARESSAPKTRRAAAKAVPAWEKAKADARRWTDNLLARVRTSDRFDVASFEDNLGRAWAMTANIERNERSLHERRAAAAPGEAGRSRKMLELNLLYVYGNILPRILDESTSAVVPGRVYAGPDLKTSIDEADYRARDAELRRGYDVPAALVPEMPGLR